MQAYFDAYARSRPQPAPMKVQASALPPTHLPGIALPADEADLRRYDNDDWRRWRCRTAACWPGPTAHRYTPQGGSVQRQAVSGLNGARGLKIAPDGQVWSLSTGEDGAPRLQAWRPGGKPVAYAPAPACKPGASATGPYAPAAASPCAWMTSYTR